MQTILIWGPINNSRIDYLFYKKKKKVESEKKIFSNRVQNFYHDFTIKKVVQNLSEILIICDEKD